MKKVSHKYPFHTDRLNLGYGIEETRERERQAWSETVIDMLTIPSPRPCNAYDAASQAPPFKGLPHNFRQQ
ncbi:hypothetical protein LguiA_003182 [Lonicera macranthoides]